MISAVSSLLVAFYFFGVLLLAGIMLKAGYDDNNEFKNMSDDLESWDYDEEYRRLHGKERR
jgi:hypothetical protein